MSAGAPDGVAVHRHVVANLVREEADHSFGKKFVSLLQSSLVDDLFVFTTATSLSITTTAATQQQHHHQL